MGRNLKLTFGVGLLLLIFLFWAVGSIYVSPDDARPLSALPDQRPSLEYPLGTDTVGRELLAVMVHGMPLTLRLGLIAGSVGLAVGIILGFTAGYAGGVVDTVIRSAADVTLTIPALVVLVVIASTLRTALTVESMALIVASLAWMWPTRTIRAQVLSMREAGYVEIARLSGMNPIEIVAREIAPNLFPYLAASFVGAVAAAILAAIGLEALGLGPQNDPTLGMTIFWSMFYGAILRGLWYWWVPPIIVLIVIFVGLFLTSAGLDEWANPRLRRSV